MSDSKYTGTDASDDLSLKLDKYRLSRDEHLRICDLLGRAPQGVEWAIFSALWSEHCSYKSSKIYLKRIPRHSSRVLESEGENAGIIDLGSGERVAFKMESHNHPSFIEPYQGAATGVGGILRDIFTMGARPIALANYLCFGQPKAKRMPTIVDGVVRGIGGYGNCVGVPNITGQTEFDSSYNENILVNAMAVGLFRPGEEPCLSKAKGVGNLVVYVGAKTGRDGVHGASMASESFGENSAAKRPTVQIGDPFFEKLLIESCLEAIHQNLVVAIQDMGAAGLTSSSFEMAAKGMLGLTMHLDQIPLRDSTLTPEEILLSESQERMLLICEPSKLAQLQQVFHKWDLDATAIGEVIPESAVRIFWHGELLTELDPQLMVEKAPAYEREIVKWQPSRRVSNLNQLKLPTLGDRNQCLLSVLESVSGTSRAWVYQQYDQRVGTQTALDCSEPLGAVVLPDSGRALGVVLGCRPYLMRMDVEVGAIDSILQPALQLALKDFEPLAVTDCLNYGSPESPLVMGEFAQSLQTLGEACVALNTPIISGNVSFYNETLKRPITSTPAIGMVGVSAKPVEKALTRSWFEKQDLSIYLLSCPLALCGGQIQEDKAGQIIMTSSLLSEGSAHYLKQASQFVSTVRKLAGQSGVIANRLVGKYGLAYTLARMCMDGAHGAEPVGCRIDDLDQSFDGATSAPSLDVILFGEMLYQTIWVVDPHYEAEFVKAAGVIQEFVQLKKIGLTGGDRLWIQGAIDLPVEKIQKIYRSGWRMNFEELA